MCRWVGYRMVVVENYRLAVSVADLFSCGQMYECLDYQDSPDPCSVL